VLPLPATRRIDPVRAQGISDLPPVTLISALNLQMIPSDMRPYRTSSITATAVDCLNARMRNRFTHPDTSRKGCKAPRGGAGLSKELGRDWGLRGGEVAPSMSITSSSSPTFHCRKCHAQGLALNGLPLAPS
jgi:hypothetical protein